jgi:hypothetical protein
MNAEPKQIADSILDKHFKAIVAGTLLTDETAMRAAKITALLEAEAVLEAITQQTEPSGVYYALYEAIINDLKNR